MYAALMFTSKKMMEFLPNVHLLGTLIMVATIAWRGKALIPIYVYVFLDGFFSGWNEDVKKYQKLSDELEMIYQSIHAPFGNAARLWREGEKGDAAKEELIACLKDCALVNVPVLVIHPYIGFDANEGPTKIGLDRIYDIVDLAEKLGVSLAFENVEG
jgi:sugar phosphate isomerase/epimerase